MTKDNQIYRAGYVAVMGRPNVGKSTLINSMIGQKITAVSPKPQTTRKSQLGILTEESFQVIFVDTPGLHIPNHKLGQLMNQNALEVLQDSDLILFVVDGSASNPHEEDLILVNNLIEMQEPPPVFLVINKLDLIDHSNIEDRQREYSTCYPKATPILVSATRGDSLEPLLQQIIAQMPQSPPYFPDDQVTDLFEREITADLIRAACLIHLRDEVPHAIAIRIDEFTQRQQSADYIAATLFVERDSQKGIVIGAKGKMLKQIGITARKEIELMLERKIFLQLRVKVLKNWRNNQKELRRFGY
jgi:GTP-binding protein Era